MFHPEAIETVMQAKGYAVFKSEAKPYNLNLFGIRTSDDDANTFNDLVGVMYRREGRWVCFQFPATTDPGVYWREHPMNVAGTAILVPGQYRGSHKLGTHKGYEALQQCKPVKVFRDGDRDAALDFDVPTGSGLFGINIHRASARKVSRDVDKWSAGCQVVADPVHFAFLMALVREAANHWGDRFTYTLLETADFDRWRFKTPDDRAE